MILGVVPKQMRLPNAGEINEVSTINGRPLYHQNEIVEQISLLGDSIPTPVPTAAKLCGHESDSLSVLIDTFGVTVSASQLLAEINFHTPIPGSTNYCLFIYLTGASFIH